MTRVLPLLGLAWWAAATVVLAPTRWARRESTARRLGPYLGGHDRPLDGSRPTGGEAIVAVAGAAGDALARRLGRDDGLSTRIERSGLPLRASDVRGRQLGGTILALLAGLLVVAAASPPRPIALVLVAGGPALAWLAPEHRIELAIRRRHAALAAELPIVAEQLGMLLGTGHSLAGALARLAERGRGVTADELGIVVRRLRQGTGEAVALQELADRCRLGSVDRLVAVLALHRHASDLGRLIAHEARAMRDESHRNLVEQIERRSEQVWIPVTVATLVPGLLFLAIPFVHALGRFGGT